MTRYAVRLVMGDVAMDYLIAAHSDAGILKKINQDALLVKVALSALGRLCLCVVCDGMGGLSKGELASGTLIRAFERWFERDFPEMLKGNFDVQLLKSVWMQMILDENQRMGAYARHQGALMGTTVTALLIIQGQYFLMNVGDTRAYMLDRALHQLTKDQTWVQYALDQGSMTLEEAISHPRRHVLLQCVGASDTVVPDFYQGGVLPDQMFLVCTDGFRHRVSPEEFYDYLNPGAAVCETDMTDGLQTLIRMNKQRRETDNISAALIRTCREAQH